MDTLAEEQRKEEKNMAREARKKAAAEEDIAEAEVVPGTDVAVATTIPVQETSNINDSLETTNQVVLPEETSMNEAKESNDNDDGFVVKKKQKPSKPKNNGSTAVADNKSQAETKKPQAKQLEESNRFSALYKFREAESTEKEDMDAERVEEEGMKAESAEDVETKRAEEAAEKKRERNKRKRQKRKAAATATEETFFDCESDGQSESEFDYIQDISVPKGVTQETGTRGLRSSLVRGLSLPLLLVCFAGFNYFLSDSRRLKTSGN